MQKLLIPIQGDFVAPRFDLATEVLVARHERGKIVGEPKSIIMERASDEGLCQMILEENITEVVCGGIEELHYNFLTWKKVTVIDGVISGWQKALELAVAGKLKQGEILVSPDEDQLQL